MIPYRIRKRRIEVALVTTSRGKGWIVPKGSIDGGERPRPEATTRRSPTVWGEGGEGCLRWGRYEAGDELVEEVVDEELCR